MYPLSLPQQAIYLDALLRGPTTKFNMGGALIIRGFLNAELFRKSLECALGVHDVQRMRLHFDGETAIQEFLPPDNFPLPFDLLDFSDRPEPLQSAMEWLLADLARPVSLDRFPLHGDILFHLGEKLHLWYPTFHHIANDAFGHSLIAATVATAYTGLLSNNRLPEFTINSYVNFLEDDRCYADSEQFIKDKIFWQGKFQTMPEPLPFTKRKGCLKSDLHHTERLTLGVKRLLYDAMVLRCQKAGVTPSQFLLACIFAYLNRVTGCNDIVIGTPILNRSNRLFRQTAGMFMSMMPLRICIDRSESLFALASKIKSETRACYRHQRFPLGEILRRCRTLVGFCQAIFDVTFVYRKLDYDVAFGDATMRVLTLDTEVREETLSVEVDEYNADEEVNLFFNYNPQVISAAEAGQMVRAFELLFEDVAESRDLLISELRLSPKPQTVAVMRQKSRTEQTVIEMFVQRAAETPDSTAVVCGSEKMTYGELDRYSSRIATALQRVGIACEQPVAVLCDRSPEWIAAMLAILKAGCAYLPLDPVTPHERLEFILHDSGCTIMLVGESCLPVTFNAVRSIPIVEAAACSEPLAAALPLSLQKLAYIIYTSGTTGQPKGVLIEHGSFANTVNELLSGWEITARDRLLGFASPMFDASIIDNFLALAAGATLVIAPTALILDTSRFLDLLKSEKVTVATLPPAYLSALHMADLTPLRLLITAGEAANPADVAHYIRHLTYVNAYGPTEASVCASYLKLKAGKEFSGDRVPIGKAIGGTDILILDEDLNLLPIGSVGELCIGGAGLARGYLGCPDLTAERFVPNPVCKGERLYRTGDLGRLLPDGNIEFTGRRDSQVKIRGYRVELSEIETTLKTHPAVETVVVTNRRGNDKLVAYVVPRTEFEPGKLRSFLSAKLPAYMIPTHWVQIAKLPLNTSGKVSFEELPNPGFEDSYRPKSSLPKTALEKSLAGIWEEVLDVAGVGLELDFFELGGHSLKALRVMSRIQHLFGISVEMADFFANPTIASLASLISCSDQTVQAPIPKAPKLEYYPLSNAQMRIWVLAQFEGGLAAYNMPLALELKGELDADALEYAFRAVIARHDSLRTSIIAATFPLQKIVAVSDAVFNLGFSDLRDAASPEELARQLIQQEFSRPFDLTQAPLLHANLYLIENRRWLLSLVVHHIVADGWSLDVMFRELSTLYADRLAGNASSLPSPPLQYCDYSHWLKWRLERGDLQIERNYWLKQLSQPLPILHLPTDYPRPVTLGFAGAIERFQLLNGGCLNLPRIYTDKGISHYILLLSAVFTLLHRYSGDEDIIIGTPVANRERMELEEQIGCYLNTLALRLHFGAEITISELLDHVRVTVLDAQKHQSYPFDVLIQDIKFKRNPDRNPLFDVMVVMQDTVNTGFRAPGIHSSEYPVAIGSSVFDLTFHFGLSKHGLQLDLEYNTALFDRLRMERLVNHLSRIIEAILVSPDMRLAEIDILTRAERKQLLVEWNPSTPVLPKEVSVHHLFEAKAKEIPDATAILFEDETITYAMLNASANKLARLLIAVGVKPDARVAIALERSPEMIVALVATLKAGGAYLPLDPAYPAERLAFMLDDSGAQILITKNTLSQRLQLSVAHTICLDLDEADISRQSGSNCDTPVTPADLAYVIYTSGSTGIPKGVAVEHRSIAHHCQNIQDYYEITPQDRVFQFSSFSFDASTEQILATLCAGAALVLPPPGLQTPEAVLTSVQQYQVTVLDIPPAFTYYWPHSSATKRAQQLRLIVLGGDSLPPEALFKMRAGWSKPWPRFLNAYGPTEATVTTTFYDIPEIEFKTSIPIGRPLPRRTIYVLDRYLQPTPIGVPGELHIGGMGLARGYLNRPELTAEKFIPDPFSNVTGARLYKTGDLVRYRPDGNLEFLGRLDHQVKIRGFRVELGEIEVALTGHPAIREAVVVASSEKSGNKRLVAYLVADDALLAVSDLRTYLKTTLPDYMLPAAVVYLDSLPLTSNGKIDRKALPEPAGNNDGACYKAPRDSVEQQLVLLWESVLSARPIGIEDNFFEIGGHSLLAVRLVAEIDKHFGKRLPVRSLFEFPTISGIASLLRKDTELPEASCLVRIRPQGSRQPLFFLPGVGGEVSYLYPLAQQLDPEIPFFAFQAQGVDGKAAPHESIEAMAEHYVDLLLEDQPHGPYFMAGHSFGGQVVFAMAQILLARGEAIAQLAIVDTYAPGACSGNVSKEIADDTSLMLDIGQLFGQLFHEMIPAREDIEGLRVEEQLAYFAHRLEDANLLPAGGGAVHLQSLLNVYKAHLQMLHQYLPESTLPLPITLFRSSEAMANQPPEPELSEDFGWGRYSSQPVPVHYLPGNHLTMMVPPNVTKLAQVLSGVTG